MANYTGADVINAGDVSNYQADIYGFGIASGTSEVAFFITQTTNDILRDLRIRWWPSYKSNVFTDITVLGSAELVTTKVNLDQFKRAGVYLFLSRYFLPSLTKFKPEADKDRFERMIELIIKQQSVLKTGGSSLNDSEDHQKCFRPTSFEVTKGRDSR